MTRSCALVTGGSRGIGAEIAGRLAVDGFDLTLVARDSRVVEETAARIRGDSSVRVLPIAANVADEAATRAVADRHREEYGRLDVLVLSAGVGTAGPLADTTLAAYQRTMDVNVRSALILIQELLPVLRESARANPSRGAKIIALSSLTGVVGEAGLAVYGASKAALISLCETLCLEESANGVAATALSPGYVDTEMSTWKHGVIDPEAMLRAADVAEMAMAISRLSAAAVVPNVSMSRAGHQIWRA